MNRLARKVLACAIVLAMMLPLVASAGPIGDLINGSNYYEFTVTDPVVSFMADGATTPTDIDLTGVGLTAKLGYNALAPYSLLGISLNAGGATLPVEIGTAPDHVTFDLIGTRFSADKTKLLDAFEKLLGQETVESMGVPLSNEMLAMVADWAETLKGVLTPMLPLLDFDVNRDMPALISSALDAVTVGITPVKETLTRDGLEYEADRYDIKIAAADANAGLRQMLTVSSALANTFASSMGATDVTTDLEYIEQIPDVLGDVEISLWRLNGELLRATLVAEITDDTTKVPVNADLWCTGVGEDKAVDFQFSAVGPSEDGDAASSITASFVLTPKASEGTKKQYDMKYGFTVTEAIGDETREIASMQYDFAITQDGTEYAKLDGTMTMSSEGQVIMNMIISEEVDLPQTLADGESKPAKIAMNMDVAATGINMILAFNFDGTTTKSGDVLACDGALDARVEATMGAAVLASGSVTAKISTVKDTMNPQRYIAEDATTVNISTATDEECQTVTQEITNKIMSVASMFAPLMENMQGGDPGAIEQ